MITTKPESILLGISGLGGCCDGSLPLLPYASWKSLFFPQFFYHLTGGFLKYILMTTLLECRLFKSVILVLVFFGDRGYLKSSQQKSHLL